MSCRICMFGPKDWSTEPAGNPIAKENIALWSPHMNRQARSVSGTEAYSSGTLPMIWSSASTTMKAWLGDLR